MAKLLALIFLDLLSSLINGDVVVGAPATFKVSIPSFVDCTGAEHSDWQLFRELFRRASEDTRKASPGGDGEPAFPGFQPELADEAKRLYERWFSVLPVGFEDYPTGAAAFYHGCHFGERSDYCLYGHVAAMAYLAEHVSLSQRYDIARMAMRLLHWNHCLDFLESSSWASWGFSVLHLWDIVQSFAYPQVTLLHQHLEFGPGTMPEADLSLAPAGDGLEEEDGKRRPAFWVLEFGSHRALSNEPIAMLSHALSGYDVTHQNFVKPYEGRAEAFVHPFPQSCSPNCPYQQDSVPYTFPVFEDMEESRRGFHAFLLGNYLNKPEVRKASIFLCTNPIFYCSYFVGLNKTVLGYFGLPLLYMVPHDGWEKWVSDFSALASSPLSLFVSNNALHAEQTAWQSGVRLPVLRPVVLYLKETYNPVRADDVLVPEPREACVLHCILRAFTPAGYPLHFLGKADTDRSYKTFATFRAVVLFPHDFALMTFYEFYAMGVPLFLPSHLSKYLFPFSASVPLLDWVPDWLSSAPDRPPYSPLSLTSSAALRYWSKSIDFFSLPAVQLFPSVAALLEMLPTADVHAISARMRENRQARLDGGVAFWRAAAASALRDWHSAA